MDCPGYPELSQCHCVSCKYCEVWASRCLRGRPSSSSWTGRKLWFDARHSGFWRFEQPLWGLCSSHDRLEARRSGYRYHASFRPIIPFAFCLLSGIGLVDDWPTWSFSWPRKLEVMLQVPRSLVGLQYSLQLQSFCQTTAPWIQSSEWCLHRPNLFLV